MTEEATPEIDQQAVLTAALIKAGADEAHAQAMGSPFPGIICATLRATASCAAALRHTPLGWPVLPEV